MIKQPIVAVISGILLLVLIVYVIERISFINKAVDTTGSVIKISSYNGTCGGRRNKYSCTKFNADVEFFDLKKMRYVLSIGAGSSRGHNRGKENANVRVSDRVGVKYDPDNPSKAYENTVWGVWGGPIMVLIFQISTFFGSFTEPKRRYT